MAGFSVQVALSTTGLSSSLWPFSTTSGYVQYMMGALYSVPVLFKQCRPCTMQTLYTVYTIKRNSFGGLLWNHLTFENCTVLLYTVFHACFQVFLPWLAPNEPPYFHFNRYLFKS